MAALGNLFRVRKTPSWISQRQGLEPELVSDSAGASHSDAREPTPREPCNLLALPLLRQFLPAPDTKADQQTLAARGAVIVAKNPVKSRVKSTRAAFGNDSAQCEMEMLWTRMGSMTCRLCKSKAAWSSTMDLEV
eukprot:2681836-Rhodomonas_salina.2